MEILINIIKNGFMPNNEYVKFVQTTNEGLSNCSSYGSETIIINTDGGLYLGNNSADPLKITVNSSDLSKVATSGSYKDLIDTPSIPDMDDLATEDFVQNKIDAIEYIAAVDTTESVDGVSNDFVTSEQLDARDYATTTSVNQHISTLENKDNSLSNRITKLENNSIIDARASVLWLGTSIPSGDINVDPQQINTYPRMVADALAFELYNQAKAGSFVAWYPTPPAWTTSA